MIAALRRRHRLAWSLLALLAPALLVAALVVRAARPSEQAPPLPGALLAQLGAATDAANALTAPTDAAPWPPDRGAAPGFGGLPLHVRVVAAARADGSAHGGARLLELRPVAPLLEPDVLVYVAPLAAGDAAAQASAGVAVAADAAALPAGARLLGALSGTLARRWPLPADAAELLLYSLGHQRLLARGPLPALSAADAPAGNPAPPAASPPAHGPAGGAR